MAEREERPVNVPPPRGGASPLSLDTHRALEALIGVVLLFVPFLLTFLSGEEIDFSTGAIVAAAVIGAAIATLGFVGSRTGNPIPVSLHALLDRVLTVVLLLAALLFLIDADEAGAIFLGVCAIAYGALGLTTRYTERY